LLIESVSFLNSSIISNQSTMRMSEIHVNVHALPPVLESTCKILLNK